MIRIGLTVLGMLTLMNLSACATINPIKTRHTPADSSAEVYDPFEPINRATYKFNDGLDKVVIGPVARSYQKSPRFLRNRIRNFSNNLAAPFTILNELIQLDFKDAEAQTGRFLLNSSLGVGGLFDIATRNGGPAHKNEDLGQTLGTYNIAPGPYLILPLLGPTNFRDGLGRAGQLVANPLTWTDFGGDVSFRASTGVIGGLDRRARVDDQLNQIRQSADPYVRLRGLYNQSRNVDIHEDADPFADLPDFDE